MTTAGQESSATTRQPPLHGIATIEQAATIGRQLAAGRPDAFLPDLAGSLNNQSIRLTGLGRREEALAAIEEAAGIYRQLAAGRPDAFLPTWPRR